MTPTAMSARAPSGSLRIDLTPPVASLTGAPNPALAGRLVTFDGAGSRDAGSGVVRYEWDLDGDGSFERDGGATASTTQAFAEPGTYAVQLRVTDRAGPDGGRASRSARDRRRWQPRPAG